MQHGAATIRKAGLEKEIYNHNQLVKIFKMICITMTLVKSVTFELDKNLWSNF